jgi:cytochrome bd-type quinol oxidase subunit 2
MFVIFNTGYCCCSDALLLKFWRNDKIPTFGRIFIIPKPTTMNYSSSEIFIGLLRALPQLAIFIVCVVFVVKKRRVDAILLTIGSFLGLVATIFHAIAWPLLSDNSSRYEMLNAVGSISILGSLVFVAGFIVLIINSIKTPEK